MKQVILSFLIFPFIMACNEADSSIAGDWKWSYDNNNGQIHEAELHLRQVANDSVVGSYCSVYGNGAKVDCPQPDAETIQLSRQNTIRFRGSFQSAYSLAKGKIEFRFAGKDRLFIDILQEPDGEFYLPDEVYFQRK